VDTEFLIQIIWTVMFAHFFLLMSKKMFVHFFIVFIKKIVSTIILLYTKLM
jgi:hypothetical protein